MAGGSTAWVAGRASARSGSRSKASIGGPYPRPECARPIAEWPPLRAASVLHTVLFARRSDADKRAKIRALVSERLADAALDLVQVQAAAVAHDVAHRAVDGRQVFEQVFQNDLLLAGARN